MAKVLVYRKGQIREIWLWDDAGKELNKCLSCLTDGHKNAIRALAQRLADHKTINNKQHFRNEGDGIWALKHLSSGLRLYGQFDGAAKAFVIVLVKFKDEEKLQRNRDTILKRIERYKEATKRGER